jgi:hypothetical protein
LKEEGTFDFRAFRGYAPRLRPHAEEQPAPLSAEAAVVPVAQPDPAPAAVPEPAPVVPVAAPEAVVAPAPAAAADPEPGLYAKYVRLKELSGGLAENLSPEQFEDRLARHRATLKARYGQDFDFDVVSRDGKVTIVAKKK